MDLFINPSICITLSISKFDLIFFFNRAYTDMAIMEVEMLSGYSARNPEALENEVDIYIYIYR